MTDREIIRAFEHCRTSDTLEACKNCPGLQGNMCAEGKTYISNGLIEKVLALLKRQALEIEKLYDMLDCAQSHEAEAYNDYKEECATVEKLEMEIRVLRATTEQLNKKLDEMTLGDLLVFKIHKFIEAVKGAKDNGRNE